MFLYKKRDFKRRFFANFSLFQLILPHILIKWNETFDYQAIFTWLFPTIQYSCIIQIPVGPLPFRCTTNMEYQIPFSTNDIWDRFDSTLLTSCLPITNHCFPLTLWTIWILFTTWWKVKPLIWFDYRLGW